MPEEAIQVLVLRSRAEITQTEIDRVQRNLKAAGRPSDGPIFNKRQNGR